MYPVTQRFLDRLAEDHRPVFDAVLFRTDGKVDSLEVTGGSVTVDRGAAVRRTCTPEFADVSLIPRTETDRLSVYGARLRISRGVDFGDGTTERVPLGVFRVDDVDGDPDLGPVTLTGQSLEVIVADDKFIAPYRATGTAVGAIEALVQRSIPDAVVVSRVPDAPIGARTWDVEGDPWAAAQECAATLGAEVYADADGVFIVAALPDLLTTDPVWTVGAGERGVLLSAVRGMSAAGVHNGVLARGENTEGDAPPVQWLAVDDDPGSPTYWGGQFGRRPTFHTSSTLTTVNACQQAANLLLAKSKAPNAKGDFSSLPNPALEPGDVLRVIYGDRSRELHQAQAFTVPLSIDGDFPITTISAKEDA